MASFGGLTWSQGPSSPITFVVLHKTTTPFWPQSGIYRPAVQAGQAGQMSLLRGVGAPAGHTPDWSLEAPGDIFSGTSGSQC